jgi:hypothetical protein
MDSINIISGSIQNYSYSVNQTRKNQQQKSSTEKAEACSIVHSLIEENTNDEPKSSLKMAIILSCTAVIGFCMFVSQGVQNGIENQFQAADGLNVTHSTYMSFMTFFSILNIPGSFLGGFIVNWMTARHCAILCACMGFIGQILSTLGAYFIHIPLMLVGRSLFGLSVEIINICVFAQIVYWFQGRLYNFAYATTVATARLGMVTIMLLGPALVKKWSIDNCILFMYDSEYCKTHGFLNDTVTEIADEFLFIKNSSSEEMQRNMTGYMSAQYQIITMYGITCAVMLLSIAAAIVMFVITPPFKTFKKDKKVTINYANSGIWIRVKKEAKSIFNSIKKVGIQCAFTVPCWLVMATCAIFYMGIEPWVMGAKNSNEKYHHEEDTSLSATLSTMLSIVPIFGCPLMGIIIDKYQNNAIFCLFGGLLSAFGHFLLILGGQGIIPQVLEDGILKTPFSVLLAANIILGIGYCMVASSIWTLLSFTVTSEDANIAYGMIQSLQHVGFIAASEISAAIIKGKNYEQEYYYSEIFYTAMYLLSMITIGLFVIFYGGGSKSLYSDSSYRRLSQ